MSHFLPSLVRALEGTWPPFLLVSGLLLIGIVAATDGLFEAIGSRLARLPGNGFTLFLSLMLLVAVVTVVLNLDTSVVFLTPILLHAAKRKGLPDTAFLYGAVFMSNAASLLLPGSNLTNLLVLSQYHVSGGEFGLHMLPAWVASIIVTAGVVMIWRWRDLGHKESGRIESAAFRPGLGLVGVLCATVLVLTLHNAGLPVLAIGIILAGMQVALVHRLTLKKAVEAVSIATVGGLFVFAVALGTLARIWGAPGHLMAQLGPWATAAVGAVASSIFNNLPATVLLSSRPPAQPLALLIGLDLGPNLVVTGALSAILWLRVARAQGATPSALTYSKVGIVLVPVSIAASLVALEVCGATHL